MNPGTQGHLPWPTATDVSGRLSAVEGLPLSLRAVLRFHARSGTLDHTALLLRRRVERTLEGIVEDCYRSIERELAGELGRRDVSFAYETKLTLPVELTLGYLYRRALSNAPDGYDPIERRAGGPVRSLLPFSGVRDGERLERRAREEIELVEAAERMARLCTEALLDGDMQDAINDDEYGDFRVEGPATGTDTERIARVAQSCLHRQVEDRFAEFPDAVRTEYDRAVERSNRHQAEDRHFRNLLSEARAGDEAAVEAIEREYKHPSFAEPPAVLTDEERSWPYCKTQYERVGVIYDGMIEMFRAADLPIDEAFKRSVVLAIIGAQIWLDDVDDFAADMEAGQLTPVTAEYVVCDSPRRADENVVATTERYLDRTVEYALESGSRMTGIAAEYIRLAGTPGELPGSRR
jgi:hypothetical protein